MSTPDERVTALLEFEFARHEEFAEGIRARHGEAIGNLLIDLARNAWNLRNVLTLQGYLIPDTPEHAVARAVLEQQVKAVSNNASVFGHQLLVQALEKKGPVTREILDREQAKWIEEINTLMQQTAATEASLINSLKGKR